MKTWCLPLPTFAVSSLKLVAFPHTHTPHWLLASIQGGIRTSYLAQYVCMKSSRRKCISSIFSSGIKRKEEEKISFSIDNKAENSSHPLGGKTRFARQPYARPTFLPNLYVQHVLQNAGIYFLFSDQIFGLKINLALAPQSKKNVYFFLR